MKVIYHLGMLTLMFTLCSCSGSKTELDRLGLKGQVKSIREIECDPTYENDSWVAGEHCSGGYRLINFDPQGNYQNILIFNSQDDTVSLAKIRYEGGDMVEEIYYLRRSLTPKHYKLVQASRTVMDRVSKDQVNFEVWQNDALSYEGGTYYDSKGRIEKQAQVVQNREVMIYHVYEKDLLVENYQLETDGTRSATQLYDYIEFDEKGNWTVKLIYLGEEKISPEVAVSRTLEYY